ncbi:MAG: hypothetical protein ABGY09_05965 [Euryarchaeota archaeon]
MRRKATLIVLRNGWTIPEVVNLIKRAKNDVVVVVGEVDSFNREVLSSVCRSLDKMVLFGDEYVDKFSIDERLETVRESPPIRHCDLAVLEEPAQMDGQVLLDVKADEKTIDRVLTEAYRHFNKVCRYERNVRADAYLVVDRRQGRIRLYAQNDSNRLREFSMKVATMVAGRKDRSNRLRRVALASAVTLVVLGVLLSGLLLTNLHHVS